MVPWRLEIGGEGWRCTDVTHVDLKSLGLRIVSWCLMQFLHHEKVWSVLTSQPRTFRNINVLVCSRLTMSHQGGGSGNFDSSSGQRSLAIVLWEGQKTNMRNMCHVQSKLETCDKPKKIWTDQTALDHDFMRLYLHSHLCICGIMRPLRRHLSLNQNGLANDFELRCGKWFWPRKSTRRLWQNALRLGSQLVSRGAPSIMNFNGNQLYFNCCCPCCPKNSWFSCVARRRILSFAILSLLMSCYHAIMTWPMMRIIERHWFFYDSLIWTE